MEEKSIRDIIMMAAGLIIVIATVGVIVTFIHLRDRFASVHNNVVYSEELIEQYREFNKYNTGNIISNIEAFEAIRFYSGSKDVEVYCDLSQIYNDATGHAAWTGLISYTNIYRFDTNHTRDPNGLPKSPSGDDRYYRGITLAEDLMTFDKLNPLFSKLNKCYFKTYLIYTSRDPIDPKNSNKDVDYSMDQVTGIRIVGATRQNYFAELEAAIANGTY